MDTSEEKSQPDMDASQQTTTKVAKKRKSANMSTLEEHLTPR
jgi:hypothetical protein